MVNIYNLIPISRHDSNSAVEHELSPLTIIAPIFNGHGKELKTKVTHITTYK